MNMKKLASLLLALLMVMSVATAMAEISNKKISPENFLYIRSRDLNGSIEVTNPVDSQTYTAHKIFDVMYDGNGNFAYTIDESNEWFEDVAEYEAVELTQVGTLSTYVVEVTENFSAADFAAYLKTKVGDKKAGVTLEKGEDGKTDVDKLPHGYYFVTSTMGALCSLTTTTPHAKITEKNEAPVVTKEVQEDSTGAWGETNDADIGQVVNFRATITVKSGAQNYILHDTMSEGLTYTGVTSVTVNGEAVDADNYAVKTPGDCGCTFEVVFENSFIDAMTKLIVVNEETKQVTYPTIVVEYSAVLNENAVVGADGNPNEVKLQYGDENKPSYTPVDTTITYTWDVDVEKYAIVEIENEDGTTTKTEVNLSGATFTLSKNADGSNPFKLHNLGDNNYEVCVAANCEKEHVTSITTTETGTFHIEGLDADTYYLTETQAPVGYNLLSAPIKVVIDNKGVVTVVGEQGEMVEVNTVRVLNTTGSQLPETGGTGTTMLYIVGGALMLAAFVLIVSKRRATEN